MQTLWIVMERLYLDQRNLFVKDAIIVDSYNLTTSSLFRMCHYYGQSGPQKMS